MATEPTLGQRIMDAVTAWSIAVQDQSEAIDGDSWEDSYDASVNEGMVTLRALAARADAAERLAKAAVALPIARAKWAAADDASDIIDAFEAFTVVRKEHEQAADMWRVITEGNEVPS